MSYVLSLSKGGVLGLSKAGIRGAPSSSHLPTAGKQRWWEQHLRRVDAVVLRVHKSRRGSVSEPLLARFVVANASISYG